MPNTYDRLKSTKETRRKIKRVEPFVPAVGISLITIELFAFTFNRTLTTVLMRLPTQRASEI